MTGITGIPRVDAYLARLDELPAAEWLRIGALEQRRAAAGADRSTAALLAEIIVADRRLEMVRWYALDAIETSAAVAGSALCPATRGMRELVAFARRAAEGAALALIAQPDLPAADFATLGGALDDLLHRHAAGR